MPERDDVFSRQISPFEWFHQTNPRDSMVVQIFVEGSGSITMEDLRRAVTVAGDACPGARLARQGRRWVDSGIPPEVRVMEGAGRDPVLWADDPQMQRSVRGDGGGPTTEVVLLTGDRPAVVFRAHHSVMDGRGTLLWATEVFRALRGLTPQDAKSPLTEIDFVRQVDYEPGKPTRKRVSPVLQSTAVRFSKRGGFSRRRTVEGNHPALVAKIAVAVTRLCELETTPFLVPVDLRRHDRSIRTTGNVSLGLTLTVDRSMTWQEAQQRIRQSLMDKAEMSDLGKQRSLEGVLHIPLGALRTMAHMGDAFVARRGNFWTFSLSNIGRVDMADFTTGSFQASAVFLALRRGLYALPTFFLSQSADRTEIVLCADEGPGIIERAEELLDGIVADLSSSGSGLPGHATAPLGGQRRRDHDLPKAGPSLLAPTAARSLFLAPPEADSDMAPKAARSSSLAPPEADSDMAAPPEADSDMAAPPEAQVPGSLQGEPTS